MKAWQRTIKRMEPCGDALEWAEGYDTIEEAWEKCERGDWMLWLLEKLSGDPKSEARKKLVLIACRCARLSLPCVKKGEKRPRKAIETAEAWAHGGVGVTLEDVRTAAAAAYAAYAAAYAAAAYAAYAAAYAAYAAHAAAYAAHAAAYAAYAAADATDAADARWSTLKKCADIVREYYPEAPTLRR